MIKNVLLFLWQLPQNVLGAVICLFIVDYDIVFDKTLIYIHYKTWMSSFSLGCFIVMNGFTYKEKDVKHERGHQRQSEYLGPLYLLMIALPSFIGHLWDRFVHKKWTYAERIKWYYNQPWEKWADKLGGVNRDSSKEERNILGRFCE